MPTEINEFLNQKSMLTPGAAGGSTLLITNTLGSTFGLPLGYVALLISGLFGLLVAALTAGVPVWQRGVFFVLNTLIIFCVAMGTNSAGQKVSEARTTNVTVSFVTAAHAQDASSGVPTASEVVKDVEAIAENPSLTADEKLEAIMEQLDTAGPQPESEKPQGFFQLWNF